MNNKNAQTYVNQYVELMDAQLAAYESYAHKHSLTAKELFVLYLIWFSKNGCRQSEICERLSLTKQTVSAIIKKFCKRGYLSLTEAEDDHRNKVIRFTDSGTEYARNIIPPIVSAETNVMSKLDKKNVEELIRLTSLFLNCIKEEFPKA